VVRTERKPRKHIAYKDVGKRGSGNLLTSRLTHPATAVACNDNLEFLSDVVPRTKTFRQVKEEKAREEAAATKAAGRPPAGRANGVNSEHGRSIEQMISRQQDQGSTVNGGPMVDRTINHAHGHPQRDEDVEMSG
jgi:hypothetical protein